MANGFRPIAPRVTTGTAGAVSTEGRIRMAQAADTSITVRPIMHNRILITTEPVIERTSISFWDVQSRNEA